MTELNEFFEQSEYKNRNSVLLNGNNKTNCLVQVK